MMQEALPAQQRLVPHYAAYIVQGALFSVGFDVENRFPGG